MACAKKGIQMYYRWKDAMKPKWGQIFWEWFIIIMYKRNKYMYIYRYINYNAEKHSKLYWALLRISLHQNITEVHCKLAFLLRTDGKSYLTSKSVLTVNDLISYITVTVI